MHISIHMRKSTTISHTHRQWLLSSASAGDCLAFHSKRKFIASTSWLRQLWVSGVCVCVGIAPSAKCVRCTNPIRKVTQNPPTFKDATTSHISDRKFISEHLLNVSKPCTRFLSFSFSVLVQFIGPLPRISHKATRRTQNHKTVSMSIFIFTMQAFNSFPKQLRLHFSYCKHQFWSPLPLPPPQSHMT